MSLIIIIFILIILNLVLLFFLNKRNIKKFIHKAQIEEIDIEDVHKIFHLKEVTKNLKGPKEDAIIRSFSISPDNNVID